jgi:glycosyltransferase involved in cell wall biosynthesis
MKIAFDLRRIKNPGIGRYMKCLVEAILARAPQHEYLLILPPDAKEVIKFQDRRVENILSPSGYYSLQEQVELPRLLRRHKADLLHAPHFNIPLMRPCPTVVTIHDVIYLACKQDMPSRLGRLYYRAMMAAAVRLADRVITVSEFSRNEILRYFSADSTKIDVVHSGVDPGFQRVSDKAQIETVLSRYRIDEDFILYTGIYKPRKNHAGLLRAFREFLKNGETAKLVIAGPIGHSEGEAELRRLGNELGLAGKLIFTGFVPESDLTSLYSAARVYACPSLYEGFGFTVLEAMTCGVPVVCSRNTSLAEVAGDAALQVDSQSPHEFATALRRAFSEEELRRQLIDQGHNNCRRFSWQRAASETLAAYERVAGLPVEKAVFA